MLARQRAAVLEHQVGGLVEEAAPAPQAAGALEIEVDPAVRAAVAEVAVHRGAVAVAVEQVLERAQVAAQVLGRDGGVLPALPVVGLDRVVSGRAQTGLAHVPELALVRRVVVEPH